MFSALTIMKALLWRLCDVFWIFNIFIKKNYIHIYIWCLCPLRYTTEKAQCWRGQEHPWYHMISLLSCYFKNTTLHTCSIRRSHDLWVYSLRLVTYSNSSMTYTHTHVYRLCILSLILCSEITSQMHTAWLCTWIQQGIAHFIHCTTAKRNGGGGT